MQDLPRCPKILQNVVAETILDISDPLFGTSIGHHTRNQTLLWQIQCRIPMEIIHTLFEWDNDQRVHHSFLFSPTYEVVICIWYNSVHTMNWRILRYDVTMSANKSSSHICRFRMVLERTENDSDAHGWWCVFVLRLDLTEFHFDLPLCCKRCGFLVTILRCIYLKNDWCHPPKRNTILQGQDCILAVTGLRRYSVR